MPDAAVGVLAHDHDPADVVHQEGSFQVGLGEGRVVPLGLEVALLSPPPEQLATRTPRIKIRIWRSAMGG
jgi:hypothetical protein